MISEECLTIEWIETASAQNNNGDKILVEKAIRALRLLEGLVEENVEFVFIGGTSLTLQRQHIWQPKSNLIKAIFRNFQMHRS